ncbi:hypothetical protein GCM10008939_23030 [Deinococcus aquiradiocola]|uniref:BNR repeat-containing family member n=2 Tax=Deinococcus aquiradiocola TaxID=393059 RepID=A0A917UQV4_9DEIO|nr:hypothetical protein GCM10008939_23030 [Deinococcus aquiradiocola]
MPAGNTGSTVLNAQADATHFGQTNIEVRQLGSTPQVPGWVDVHRTGQAVRSARRPTPSAIYLPATQQTVVSWMGAMGHPFVRTYDHVAQAWSEPVQVGMNPYPDYHNYPVMAQAADGHLLVAYGAHNTVLRMSRSAQPNSAAGPWEDVSIPEAPAASYPFAFTSATGRTFVFYRETLSKLDPARFTDDRPLRYVMTEDNGRTWKNSTTLTGQAFALGSVDRTDQMNEIYLGQARLLPPSANKPERVIMSWTIAGGGTGQSHLHDRYHRNMYVAYFRPADLHFFSPAGKDLGTQLSNEEMEGDCKVLDTGEPKYASDQPGWTYYDVGYFSVVHEKADGSPVVLYTTFDGTTAVDRSSVWTGSSWVTATVPFNPKDLEQRGSVLSAYANDSAGIREWNLVDGTQFVPGPRVTYNRPPGSGIEMLIQNYRQPLQFLTASTAFSGVSDSTPSLDVGVVGIE